MTIRHGPILEIAEQIVERTVFLKKAKCLLSDCFIHICCIIHLLRREVHEDRRESALKKRPTEGRADLVDYENRARKRKRGEIPNFYEERR